MQKPHQKDKGKPLLADDARDLILRLIDPGDAQSLPTHCEHEERLQILLYFLKTAGFNASGLKCMAQAGKVATSSQLKDTTVCVIAIREGGVSEVFSLHKKIKVSIVQEEDVDEQVTQATRFLSKMSAGRVFDTIHWEESYPEPMKPKHLLAEIKSSTQDHSKVMDGLKMIMQAWKLRRETPAVETSRARPRL